MFHRDMAVWADTGLCNNLTVIQQHCSPDLEYFFKNCKLFYFPREFTSFILVGVYISQRTLTDQILSVELTNPDSLVIVLCDFNV